MRGERAVTELDWIIVAFAALLAWLGYRQGFIVGVLSLGGFLVGAFVGTRLATVVLPSGSASPFAPAFGLLGALLAGAVLATGLEGVGMRLRRALGVPGMRVIDGALGAILSGAVAVGIVWVVAAVGVQVPGEPALRSAIQSSAILRALNERLPPSGPILGALARLDPLPSIAGPSPAVPPPPQDIAGNAEARRAARSVVRILGTACGLAIEGSGWVVAPEEVVTNAHVVAGEQDITVGLASGRVQLAAVAVAFDPEDDVAVLHVPGLRLPALALLKSPAEGTPGVILGYPEDGPLDGEPARIGATGRELSENAYGEGPVMRTITSIRGLVRPGNSGGPVVDRHGRVLTMVFAATTGHGYPAGYGVANGEVARIVDSARGRVSTGHCTSA